MVVLPVGTKLKNMPINGYSGTITLLSVLKSSDIKYDISMDYIDEKGKQHSILRRVNGQFLANCVRSAIGLDHDDFQDKIKDRMS